MNYYCEQCDEECEALYWNGNENVCRNCHVENWVDEDDDYDIDL